MFKSIKKLFGFTPKEKSDYKNTKDNYQISNLGNINKIKNPTRLDPTNADNIIISKLKEPDLYSDHKPEEYWEIYNKGVSHYKRKWYEKSKIEFIKLLEFQNPHEALYTYLLRTFRKTTSRNIEKNKLAEAYEDYISFFKICDEFITNTDRKKFNKLVEKLKDKYPDSDYINVKLQEPKIQPDFELRTYNNYQVSLIKEQKNDAKPSFKDIGWNYQGVINRKQIYVKRVYDQDTSEYDKTLFVIRNPDSNATESVELNHKIIDFDSSQKVNKFIFLTEDLKLFLFSMNEGIANSIDLSHLTNNKNYVRSINISDSGEYILYTIEDTVYLLNAELKQIGSWTTPIEEGWELRNDEHDRADNPEIQDALRCLDLDIIDKPQNENIKKAYKKRLLECHPDLNPNDPLAKEKTRGVIKAYETLTGEDARLVFQEEPNSEYYFKLIDEYKMDIPEVGSINISFGYVGSGKDWIYASYVSENAERIYLGCYSGKVYCITKGGTVKKIYNCNETVKKKYTIVMKL